MFRRFRINILLFWVAGFSVLLGVTACVPPKPTAPPRVTHIDIPHLPPVPRSEYPRPPAPSGRLPSADLLRGLTIVVDPGHGGKDPGARGKSSLPEKTIVLDIASQIADLLAQQGARVIMTRDADYFVELDERAAIAERTHTDLLVSIHADASKNGYIDGATVLVGTTASNLSKQAARCIKTALQRYGISIRETRAQQLRVLDNHSRPAVLVECGFLTNLTDARRLNASWYRDRLARAVAEGIVDFFVR